MVFSKEKKKKNRGGHKLPRRKRGKSEGEKRKKQVRGFDRRREKFGGEQKNGKAQKAHRKNGKTDVQQASPAVDLERGPLPTKGEGKKRTRAGIGQRGRV